jgi:two-component system, LytTR family, response regulator|tara:strand:- start:1536 stop:2240 length:705 start_codon:yes stop_codon:yes gene_type:complete
MIKVLMVEDERGAVEVFQNLIARHQDSFEFLGAARNVKDAVTRIEEDEPDLLILDISLPDGTGFDVLEIIGDIRFEVIFLTAHESFAIKAIKNNAFDYILKPFQSTEMNEALRKVKLKLEDKTKKNGTQKIALHTQEGIDFIKIEDLLYLKASSNYTEIYLIGGEKLLASKTLKNFERLLDHPMHRIHNSYMINLKFVKKFDKSESSIYLETGKSLPVSKQRKSSLFQHFAKEI